MFDTPQFVTGPFTPQRVFLPEREYGLALDALVKGCSDVLVVSSDGKKVLLGKRKVKPQPDWWFIGGRSRPGDTTIAAARRNLKRELGLDFPESRYEVVANYSMVWSYREQKPSTNGTADISTVHSLCLTREEEARGVPALDPDEYHESKWWVMDDVVSQTDRFHPCLIASIKALKAKVAYEMLQKATEGANCEDPSTAHIEIVEKALNFVRTMKEAKSTEASVKVIFDEENEKYIRQDEGSDDSEEEKKSEI